MSLYQQDFTAGAIAAQLSLNEGTVYAVLKRRDIPRRRPGGRERSFSQDETTRVLEGYAAGAAILSLAQALGTTETKVSRVLQRHGITTATKRRRVLRYVRKDGYAEVWIPADHPFALMRNSGGTVPEHRLVMAEQLGRPLLESETVHHINNRRDDNAPSNLQLRQGRHGKGAAFVCLDCGSHNVRPTRIAEA